MFKMSITGVEDTDLLILHLLENPHPVSLTCKRLNKLCETVFKHRVQKDFKVGEHKPPHESYRRQHLYLTNCATIYEACVDGRLDALIYFHSMNIYIRFATVLLERGHILVLNWLKDKVEFHILYADHYPLKSVQWLHEQNIKFTFIARNMKFIHIDMMEWCWRRKIFFSDRQMAEAASFHGRIDLLNEINPPTLDLHCSDRKEVIDWFSNKGVKVNPCEVYTVQQHDSIYIQVGKKATDMNEALQQGNVTLAETFPKCDIDVQYLILHGVISSLIWCYRNNVKFPDVIYHTNYYNTDESFDFLNHVGISVRKG